MRGYVDHSKVLQAALVEFMETPDITNSPEWGTKAGLMVHAMRSLIAAEVWRDYFADGHCTHKGCYGPKSLRSLIKAESNLWIKTWSALVAMANMGFVYQLNDKELPIFSRQSKIYPSESNQLDICILMFNLGFERGLLMLSSPECQGVEGTTELRKMRQRENQMLSDRENPFSIDTYPFTSCLVDEFIKLANSRSDGDFFYKHCYSPIVFARKSVVARLMKQEKLRVIHGNKKKTPA